MHNRFYSRLHLTDTRIHVHNLMWTCTHRRRYHYRLYSGPVCLRAHILNISPPFLCPFNNVRVYTIPPRAWRCQRSMNYRIPMRRTWDSTAAISDQQCLNIRDEREWSIFRGGNYIYMYIWSRRFRNSVEVYCPGLDRTGRSHDSLSSVNYRVSRNEIESTRIASSAILT